MRLEIGHSTPLKLLSIALFPGLDTPEMNIEKIDVKYILRYIWLIQCHLWTIIWILCNTFERSTVYWYGQYYESLFHNWYLKLWFDGIFVFHYIFSTITLLFYVIYQIFHYRVFWNASGVFLVLNDEEVTTN